MKALSLLQPWASLVVLGIKTIETRSWNTHYRGSLLIHASLGKSGSIFCNNTPFKKYIDNFNKLPFGAIIGKVNLSKVLPINDLFMNDLTINKLSLEEKAFGDYAEGRYAWLLDHPEILHTPIPFRGMISLWDFPDELYI